MSQIYPFPGSRQSAWAPWPVSVGIPGPVTMGIPGADRMIVPEAVPAGFPGPVTMYVPTIMLNDGIGKCIVLN